MRGQGKKQDWERKKLNCEEGPVNNSLSQHQGSYRARLSLPSCLKLGQDPLPLAIREGVTLGKVALCSLSNTRRGLPAEGCLLTGLPAAGSTGTSLKGDLSNTSQCPYTLLLFHTANRQTNKNNKKK